jgi:hypothetical protein
MKKTTFILSLITAAIGFSFAGDNACGNFEQFNKGTVWAMSNYSDKGKLQSVVTCTVKEVTKTTTLTKADIHAVITDDKNKESSNVDYTVSCEGGFFKMDMKSFAAAASAEQAKSMKIEMEGNTMDYPQTMTVGQKLPDGEITMKLSSDGSLVMTNVIKYHDRKVEAIETKTTSAGTWECYKISYIADFESTMAMNGMKLPVKPRKTVEWFSFKVGTVRTESYKSDKMESYSELTTFKKPS